MFKNRILVRNTNRNKGNIHPNIQASILYRVLGKSAVLSDLGSLFSCLVPLQSLSSAKYAWNTLYISLGLSKKPTFCKKCPPKWKRYSPVRKIDGVFVRKGKKAQNGHRD